MFSLRRAATRFIAQSSRQISTPQPCPARVTLFQTATPKLYRPFHHSRTLLAEPPTTEPSAEEQKEVVEHSVLDSDAVSEASGTTAKPLDSQSRSDSFTDQVSNAASSAMNTVKSAADAFTPQGGDRPLARSSARGSQDIEASKILYVGNLFFEVTAPQLEAEFSQFGKIENCRIVTDTRGLSKGFGYVEFADQASASTAVEERNQRTFQGRRMAVQYHAPRWGGRSGTPSKPSSPPSKTLFIGNMSYQMSDRDLNDLFREIRDVLDVRVAIDRRSGQPRGFAHADFIDVAAAQRAKEYLEQKVIYSRQLRVDYSVSSAMQRNDLGPSETSET